MLVNILKEMFKALFSFVLKLKTLKMHQLHLNQTCLSVTVSPDAFVLRFYGPVNPMGSCRARSVYLTTRFTSMVYGLNAIVYTILLFKKM